jgi:ADP-heptose:LPS heptosyltransferase
MRILLIKLGALGDVLRTTPLLEGLRKKYPGCEITWLVDARHRGVLERNAAINRLESLADGIGAWRSAQFDLAINLDKEPEALDAFAAANAKSKLGFGRNAQGELCGANPESEYAYQLGIDDDLKFRRNRKSYQQICFEQLGLEFRQEEYIFSPGSEEFQQAKRQLARSASNSTCLVGVNTGSGTRFAGKRLPDESYKTLCEKLSNELGVTVLLLGGEDEVARNKWIEKNAKAPVVNAGSHPIGVFAGIVKACDLVITGDTTALHIAVAMRVPVLAYFASTCAQEIELYGRGRKIVSAIECSPCYKKICPIDEQCMKDMDVDMLVRNAKELLAFRETHRLS